MSTQALEERAHARVREHLLPAARRRQAGERAARVERAGRSAMPTSSRLMPATTTSCTQRAPAAMIFARSGPTLTKVPVASLKSSAMRPSNMQAELGVAPGRSSCTASPLQIEAFLVEALGASARARASSRA